LDPQVAKYYDKRGDTHKKKGEHDRAFADYDNAIRLEPQNAEYHFSRGMAYHSNDEYHRAIADYDNAVRLEPKDASYHYVRGLAYHSARNYDQAIASYNGAIQLNPRYANAYESRAAAYAAAGNSAKATADQKRADAYGSRAKADAAVGNGAKAKADSKRAERHVFNAGAPNVGDVFQDCSECPEMVKVPAGRYMMGTFALEGLTPHRVVIQQAFAAGRYEVTFDEWAACVADGGCGVWTPDDNGWGKGRRPVMGVNWHDAKSYVAWLSKKTGETYRLLTETEWEYIARAGTSSTYNTGEDIKSTEANYARHQGKTLEVGSYKANGFGLYDTHGNVNEWVEDCFHTGYYDGAPTTSDAWVVSGNDPAELKRCDTRMVRGGSWDFSPSGVQSAVRFSDAHYSRSGHNTGIRVAKTLK